MSPPNAPPAPTTARLAGNGRPRDPRIDGAVLQATTELLEEVGYLHLSIGAIADRAGTNKPAIYRRWPTKAHLVHEAVFPAQRPEVIPAGDDLRSDISALMTVGIEFMARPAARAALPGLLAETSGEQEQADLLERLGGGTWGWLERRIEGAIESGEVRADVRSSTVLDLIAGATFVAIAIRRPDEVGPDRVERAVDIIMRGIAP